MVKHGRPQRVYYHAPALGRSYLCRDLDYRPVHEGWRREHAARVWQAGAGTLLMIAYRMESARWGWHCGRDQGLAEGRVDRMWQAMQAVLALSCWVTLKQSYAIALEREHDGIGTWRETQSAFVDGVEGARAAGWDDQIP